MGELERSHAEATNLSKAMLKEANLNRAKVTNPRIPIREKQGAATLDR